MNELEVIGKVADKNVTQRKQTENKRKRNRPTVHSG
jgi:hypothetical protein